LLFPKPAATARLAPTDSTEDKMDQIVAGGVFRRCGCRDRVSGRQLNGRCPRLADPGHGHWYFAVQVSTVDGRRTRVRRGGYGSLAQAERARQALLALPDAAAAGRAWTVQRWLEQWLSSTQEHVRPSTTRGYREHVRHYLIPYLGRIRLASLCTAHVQAAFRIIASGRTRSGRLVASSTLQRIRATLRSGLSEAVRQGLITANPATGVRLPKPLRVRPVVWTATREAAWRDGGIRPAVAVWTRQHLATFLASVKNDPLFTLWWLLALTGLRRGEVAALRWSDLDLDAATLTVNEQIVVVDGQDIIGPPKSASSRRTIALDKVTVELLRRLWRHHRRARTTNGRNPDGYVFIDANGQRLRPDYLTRRLAVLIAEAGLPPVRLHDLRHGAASLALAAGVDLKVVQAMLGHASIVTTADIYTSMLSEAAHTAAEASAAFVLDAARTRLDLGGSSQA
jgi:integrase